MKIIHLDHIRLFIYYILLSLYFIHLYTNIWNLLLIYFDIKIIHLEPLDGEGDSEENAGGQAHVATHIGPLAIFVVL